MPFVYSLMVVGTIQFVTLYGFIAALMLSCWQSPRLFD